MELAGRGITAAILRPGYVDAGRGRRYLERYPHQTLAKIPLGRALTISEVVDTIMFLLSDSAVGFNATVLTMDGGLSAGK
jgi:3-oxoacyl-[acyl-carrier protein] reductase